MDPERIARARSAPIELIADSYQLKLRGCVERVGPCAVCGGTDRFSINVKKQLWNCRGCQKGGDVIALVQHLDQVDFRTAIEILTGQVSTPVSKSERTLNSAKRQIDDYEREQRRKAAYLWQNRKPIG